VNKITFNAYSESSLFGGLASTFTRTHPKTCFVTRSSEKSVVKAGGEKGFAFARERTITMIYQKYTRETYHP
jgi:hypothetical protein